MNQAQALLQAHFDTFVANPEKWKSHISDDIVCELPYATGLGHSQKLTISSRWVDNPCTAPVLFGSIQMIPQWWRLSLILSIDAYPPKKIHL